MSWFPMYSWHPVMVHLPLVGLLLAVVFDLVAVQRQSGAWRDTATALWWIGFLGVALAITTGLIAYNRVEHSELAHEEMTLHRNLALATITFLLLAALWRWKRPYSRAAALLGLAGAIGLAGATWAATWFTAMGSVSRPRRWNRSPASERDNLTFPAQ